MLAKLHRATLFANVPVVLFTIMAAYGSIFGFGTWDWVRGIWLISPILLIAWLALSTHLFQHGRQRWALALAIFPVLGLLALLAFVFASAR
jgi:hypothetical protein